MRRSLIFTLALLPVLGLAAEPSRPSLAVGKDLPGPFSPFCVSGPYINKLQAKEKDKVDGRFHCPVSAHGLEPLVLVFAKDQPAGEPFKDLLTRLDAAVEKNPNVRLGVAVVFVADFQPDVAGDDDRREAMAEKLRDLAGALKLKNVALCMDSRSDLGSYDLDKNEAAVTVVMVRRYKVEGIESIRADQLSPEKVNEVMKAVAQTLGAGRS